MTVIVNNTEPSTDSRVLYVEDDVASCNLVLRAFKAHSDLSLTIVNTLYEARREVLKAPDVILLDLHLPDGSGFEFLEFLKASPELSRIPVIVVSASAMQDEVERGLQAGVAHYLTKPLDLAELFETIHNLR